mgnify:CR=1 FL=1
MIITVTNNNVALWKNKDLEVRWETWIQEIFNFKDFPNFFEAFIKNNECVELFFQMLASKPDKEYQKSEDLAKQWEEKEQLSSKFIYQVLADSFKLSSSV